MFRVVLLALWNLPSDKCDEYGGNVLHCSPEVIQFAAGSFVLLVAAVTRIAI